MTLSAFEEALGPALFGALQTKGFSDLTLVQQAVLAPELEGRDLRVTSQTGSGKTVAIGLAIRNCLAGDVQVGEGGAARPRALVVAPTRELARQVEEELRWLFAPFGAKVASTTGGASYKDERRMLSAGPAIVVGTPGRLLEYLDRKGIASHCAR
jgi:ATP-dependent RNA helicase DeaD